MRYMTFAALISTMMRQTAVLLLPKNYIEKAQTAASNI